MVELLAFQARENGFDSHTGYMDIMEIKNRFGYHPATDDTKALHEAIRCSFTAMAEVLNILLPDSREKSLALTALQESAMWSNAAIACNLAPLE